MSAELPPKTPSGIFSREGDRAHAPEQPKSPAELGLPEWMNNHMDAYRQTASFLMDHVNDPDVKTETIFDRELVSGHLNRDTENEAIILGWKQLALDGQTPEFQKFIKRAAHAGTLGQRSAVGVTSQPIEMMCDAAGVMFFKDGRTEMFFDVEAIPNHEELLSHGINPDSLDLLNLGSRFVETGYPPSGIILDEDNQPVHFSVKRITVVGAGEKPAGVVYNAGHRNTNREGIYNPTGVPGLPRTTVVTSTENGFTVNGLGHVVDTVPAEQTQGVSFEDQETDIEGWESFITPRPTGPTFEEQLEAVVPDEVTTQPAPQRAETDQLQRRADSATADRARMLARLRERAGNA